MVLNIKSKHICIRVFNGDKKDEKPLTFKIQREILENEINEPSSEIYQLLSRTYADTITLRSDSKKIPFNEYELCFRLIRTSEPTARLKLINKLIRENIPSRLLVISNYMLELGAMNVHLMLDKYLKIWSDENIEVKKLESYLNFNKEKNEIFFCTKYSYTFKTRPDNDFEAAWWSHIRKNFPADSLVSRNTDSQSISINFIKLVEKISVGEIDHMQYRELIDLYSDEFKSEDIERLYLVSNSMSTKIDNFFGKVIGQLRNPTNGLNIEKSVIIHLNRLLLEKKINQDNIIGVISLMRDSLNFCDIITLRTIEKCIWNVLKEDDKFGDSFMFDVLYTMLLLDVTGYFSANELDENSISIIGLFTLFFSDRFGIDLLNPDYVYKFLIETFVPKELFKSEAHIYISLPESFRVYPPRDKKAIEGQ